MKLSVEDFGELPGGRHAKLYSISGDNGMTVSLCDYGARIVRLFVPDRDGNAADVVLGHDSVTPYIDADDCLGATCGRYANRLSGGAFMLNGKEYQITRNDGDNALHGGKNGFHRRLWQGEPLEEQDGVRFTYVSENGEEGFPGTLSVSVTYRLHEERVLSIDYEAASMADTPLNLTNHSYFNLAGHGSGVIDAQVLQIYADFFTPSDASLLPTGEIAAVAGTPFDFRSPKPIGRDIEAPDPQLKNGGGYDHNFVLHSEERGRLTLAARAYSPDGGRAMEVWTTLPGIQLYTANALARQTGKDGAAYDRRCAFCLETQLFPDAMRHTHFPSPVLCAGTRGASRTELRFFCDGVTIFDN